MSKNDEIRPIGEAGLPKATLHVWSPYYPEEITYTFLFTDDPEAPRQREQ
jgi:hypothetical protein